MPTSVFRGLRRDGRRSPWRRRGWSWPGAVGLSLRRGESLGYAFTWTLDTVTTLGTIPVAARHRAGGWSIVALEVFGIGTLFYGLATVAEFFVSGQLSGVLDERRIRR